MLENLCTKMAIISNGITSYEMYLGVSINKHFKDGKMKEYWTQ